MTVKNYSGEKIMLHETISLSDKHTEATLTTYVSDFTRTAPRRALIVCPGGGYHDLSPRESEPIVYRFLGKGYNVFLLRYKVVRCEEDMGLGYEPVTEAARAIAHVRENAEKYNIIPNKIFIMGFSAGGHLAASSGILWNCPALKKEFEGKPEGIGRPDGMVLSYPVITGGDFAHKKSIKMLSGHNDLTDEDIYEWSLENHVDETTPPAFVWHTVTDKVVPIQNALLIADAFTKNKVPYELHIFPEGPHGLALANEETSYGNAEHNRPNAQCWTELADTWMKNI